MNRYTLHNANNLDVLRSMPANSVDSIVTDPPYGLSFMGKKWDYDVPSVELWAECLRVLKPGGHLLAFAGTRTQHRMAVRIEDAGFEIRDMIAWVYGSGFPKSLDVSKAIDKAAGAEREDLGPSPNWREAKRDNGQSMGSVPNESRLSAPATEAARQWQGWGSALKPAMEPVTVARKPFDTTVAENVLTHGTGAINIDGCRVATADTVTNHARSDVSAVSKGIYGDSAGQETHQTDGQKLGRWPANLIHDGSEEVVAGFPATGASKSGGKAGNIGYHSGGAGADRGGHDDNGGSAARFFKQIPQEDTCALCCLPIAEACDMDSAWKSTLVSNAAKNGWTSQATSEFIARVNAMGPASARLVPHVKCAGSLCDSCAISIAVTLVATKTSGFRSEELQATLASIGSYNASILIPSLASFAELWASIDTIPTTNSLSLLFGCVRDAIANSTQRGTVEKVGQRSEPSRFAYVPKASKADRDEGCGDVHPQQRDESRKQGDPGGDNPRNRGAQPRANHHPTVKPTDLMRYLCRLVTPPGGLVLDPFMGSGSTGKAAILEGFQFIGIEREAEYVAIAERRIGAVCDVEKVEGEKQMTLFGAR